MVRDTVESGLRKNSAMSSLLRPHRRATLDHVNGSRALQDNFSLETRHPIQSLLDRGFALPTRTRSLMRLRLVFSTS
jgi:hypothetical protein